MAEDSVEHKKNINPAKVMNAGGTMGPFWFIAVWVILLGTISVVLYAVFGENTTTLITEREINGIKLYNLNLWEYLKNLNFSLNPDRLNPDIPDFYFNGLINPFISIVNILIMLVNLIAYPIRITAYLSMNLFALLGINTNPDITHNLTWLINTSKFLSELAIKYIEYSPI